MLLLLLACTPAPDSTDLHADPGTDTADTGGSTDTGDTADTYDTGDTDPPVDGCRATPRGADLDRALVLSFPYTKTGKAASTWEVLTLKADGTLTRPGTSFTMGRAFSGVAAFSPDGTLGVVPQDDGTLGIFTVDDKLLPTVVEASWAGDGGDAFYAGAVVFDPSGERAWIVDGNWENNGGGLYEVAFDCATGAPTLIGRTIASKLAVALLPDGDHAVLVAAGAAGEEGGDAWLLDGWPDAPTVAGKVTLFDYEDAILASGALAGDTLVVGDNSSFSASDNHVAAALVGDSLTSPAAPTVLLDPVAMVASPDGDAVLVSSGFGDSLYVLSVGDGKITKSSKLSAAGVALPGSSVVITRGTLAGTALVAENVAVRQVAFDGAGGAADQGATSLGDGYTAIPGAIGVQP